MDHISKHLVVQKKELQKTESLPLKIGKDFSLAIQTRRICDSTKGEIEDVLKLAMLKVGIRANNIPAKEEKFFLINHVSAHYPLMNIGEINLAFDMALSGKLGLKTDEVKCYENFSCAYLASIIHAYLVWAEDQRKQIKDEPPPQKIYTDNELDNFHREWTEEFYQQIRKGLVMPVPGYTRDILVKDGIIKEGESAAAFFVKVLNEGRENVYISRSPITRKIY